MFSSAQEFIEYITRRRSEKSHKENFFKLIDELGHPEQALKVIHVAGTNGKGSVTNYLRSILQSHGYKVGTFTSPHLTVHNDRIRINDENISDEDLLYWGNYFEKEIRELDLGMFQVDTLISIFYFLDKKVDYVVYEVGMGGRLDCTNIVTPLLSVITNIGYDHMATLGNTLPKIAYEKAGIIKEGKPVFTAEYKKSCLQVFEEKAEEMHAPLYVIRTPKASLKEDKVTFDFEGYHICLNTMALYQAKNASLALSAAEYLRKEGIIELDREDIIEGLENTSWKGRFEVVSEKPLTILDGAHNEHGIRAILDSVRKMKRPLCIVVSILKDKQYEKMISYLCPLCDELVITSFDYYRATPIDVIAENEEATMIADWKEAIRYATEKYEEGSVLITGSLYFVSEVRSMYVKEVV